MITTLYPPLSLIERELFGQEQHEAASASDAIDPAQPVAEAVPAMPAHVLALIRRKVAATQALPASPLAVGQIRGLPVASDPDGQERPLGRTCAVLLGRWMGGRRWAGWMVAQETEYATERDLVLQDDDGVMAPEAAVVQAWNPVEVELRGAEPLLGRVSASALGAVLKLADHVFTDEQVVAPRPGRVGAWDIDADTTVVTGTPLGEGDDPRTRYQELYRRLALEFAAAASDAQVTRSDPGKQAAPGWMAWLRHTFVRPDWTFGAMAIVLGQAMWMLAVQPDGAGEEARYRGAAPAVQDAACRTRIRVMFRLDTPYADLVLALRRIDATLVSGPSETGEIWILPAPDQNPQEVAAMLQQSHLVERSEVVQSDPHQCKR